MRVLMLSKALVVGSYQVKVQVLARQPQLDLTVVVPPTWRDERGELVLEKQNDTGYKLEIAPLRLNGRYHLHYYPSIGGILRRVQPDIVHLDEEPYNLATFHALWQARRAVPRARIIFFTWQNLLRTYPPPFGWIERYVYRHSDYALAGNQSAVGVLRAKGFTGPMRVIPQFGVDPARYCPAPSAPRAPGPIRLGFAGRLVPEKGAALLIRALARIQEPWELKVVGSGPERLRLEALARELGVEPRVRLVAWQSSDRMPDFYRSLDLLVAPSVSRPNWTEQFGRVLVEAMACGIPVLGSNAGEIPNVIGDAGVLFSEGNVDALSDALCALMSNPAQRALLAVRGRTRVLECFTQERIADETWAVYQELASYTKGNL